MEILSSSLLSTGAFMNSIKKSEASLSRSHLVTQVQTNTIHNSRSKTLSDTIRKRGAPPTGAIDVERPRQEKKRRKNGPPVARPSGRCRALRSTPALGTPPPAASTRTPPERFTEESMNSKLQLATSSLCYRDVGVVADGLVRLVQHQALDILDRTRSTADVVGDDLPSFKNERTVISIQFTIPLHIGFQPALTWGVR